MQNVVLGLTQSVTRKAEGPYVEDTGCGLWFDPNPAKYLDRFPCTTEPYQNEAEQKVCDFLARQLKDRLKKTDLTAYDVANRSSCMETAYKKLGMNALLVRDLDSDPLPRADIISFINTFQRLTPLEAVNALEWCAERLEPDGLVYLRLSDRESANFKNELRPEVWKHSPTFWHLESFLELLAQVEKFQIVATYPVDPSHRDITLRRIATRPKICAGMIAKNEERDLPPCLKSLEGVIDGLVLIDTGSTDRTMEIARDWAEAQPPAEYKDKFYYHIEQYTEASEKDEKGDWKLWDFGKARNRYVEMIDKTDFDYVLWMDADDKLLDPRKLRNLVYLGSTDVHGVMISSGGLRWPHHRLWKNHRGIRYAGRCHEYPGFGMAPSTVHDHVTVYHDAAPGAGESSNKRNLRILEREFQEAPNPRNAFYLANTHKDGGRFREAIPYYKARMDFGKGFEDEYWFAVLYKGRCERLAGLHDEARKTLMWAASEKPDWAEFWMELAFMETARGQHKKTVGWAMQAMDAPIVPTTLFRERDKYTDQPYRVASWAYEHLQDQDNALALAIKARELIGAPDRDWDERIARLKGSARPKSKRRVCWLRPGALGDVLMTLNLVRPFKQQNPDTEVYYQCAGSIAQMLGSTMRAAGVDHILTTNDNTHQFDHTYRLIGYPIQEGYPDRPMSKHLIEYFALELGLKPVTYSVGMPWNQVVPHAKYCTVHVKAGWSQYKNWPLDRWETICTELQTEGYAVVQIGGPDDPKLTNVTQHLMGNSFENNLWAIAGAQVHLGIDSWSNHATNFVWERKGKTPAVILWGSTQAFAAGYSHNQNISLGLPCQPCFKEDPAISTQPRGVCTNPAGQTYAEPLHACMHGIGVDHVMSAFRRAVEAR